MATGGDIQEITYNHPDLGSGTIFPKSNEESSFNLGGFRSDDDANGITGSGEMIDKINRVRPSIECTVAWDMNVREDLEKVSAMAESPKLADWTVTHVNGAIYGGKGKPVGDYTGSGNNATFTLKIAGGGKFKKI